MKKRTRTYALILISALFLAFSGYALTKYIAYRNSPEFVLTRKIVSSLQKQQWPEALEHIQKGLKNNILHSSSIRKLSRNDDFPALTRAYKATEAILKLKKTGLSFRVVFPIAFFKETHTVPLYISESRVGREVQWDPDKKLFFIHCGTHGTEALGTGYQKVVTRSVLYDLHKPQVVARGLTSCDVRNEVSAMKTFSNCPGLIPAISFLEHQDEQSHTLMTSIITPLYNQGSLEKTLKNKRIGLSFQERFAIAKEIISGLRGMHAKEYAHRDLGARNHFVSIETSPSGERTVHCVIADLEKAKPVKELYQHISQGNSAYLSPEGIFIRSLKGEMYYATDIFAIGCLFWRLYFDGTPPWSILHKRDLLPEVLQSKYEEHVRAIEKARDEMKETLLTLEDPMKKLFLEVIIQMTSPHPHERGSAEELYRKLYQL